MNTESEPTEPLLPCPFCGSDLEGVLRKIHTHLTNLQPHIEQACYPGRAVFIDNYVNPAMELCLTGKMWIEAKSILPADGVRSEP